mgnify:CR=1 FL=1
MNTNTVLNKVRELLGIEVKLEQRKLEDGVTTIEADAFEPEAEVVIITEDDQRIPLPIGEYKLEDGTTLVVTEEGIIAEIRAEAEVEEEVDEEVEAPAEEEEMKKETPVKKTVESIVKETFFTEIEALKKENEELKAEVEQLSKVEKETTTELSEEVKEEVKEDENTNEVKLDSELAPATKPISFNPENTNTKDKILYSQGRTETTLDRVFRKLNK